MNETKRKPWEKPCALCGKAIVGMNDICPVCGWQEDYAQEIEPDLEGCGNQMSFNQAKEAWAKGEKVI